VTGKALWGQSLQSLEDHQVSQFNIKVIPRVSQPPIADDAKFQTGSTSSALRLGQP